MELYNIYSHKMAINTHYIQERTTVLYSQSKEKLKKKLKKKIEKRRKKKTLTSIFNTKKNQRKKIGKKIEKKIEKKFKCHFPNFLSPETISIKCYIMQGILYRISKKCKEEVFIFRTFFFSIFFSRFFLLVFSIVRCRLRGVSTYGLVAGHILTMR